MPPSERRRNPRLGLSVPVRVTGHDPDGSEFQRLVVAAGVPPPPGGDAS